MTIKTTGAILEKHGKIFLMKRANTRVFNGYWSLPGGKIDEGESLKEAIKREIKEETNLSFTPERLFGKYEEHFPQYGWNADTKIFLGTFSGALKLNEESSEFGWFSKEEIEKMDLAFHHKKVIEDFFKQKV